MRNTILALVVFMSAAVFADQTQTPTGIPLDTPWKKEIYTFAVKNVKHPSWGVAHSERNYNLARELAKTDGIVLDGDVLFAASFLHDVGGIGSFAKQGVDHAVRSVEIAEPLLAQWGFPAAKMAQVKEMILGHVYYQPAPASEAAQAFRDADILDFIGAIGIARIFAITQEPGTADPSLGSMAKLAREFADTLPAKCSLKASEAVSKRRQFESKLFLDRLHLETGKGLAQ